MVAIISLSCGKMAFWPKLYFQWLYVFVAVLGEVRLHPELTMGHAK
jgi:hypothetical protein